MRRYTALLIAVEPGKGEATPGRVVCPPTSLISDPRRNGGLLLQPVAQRRGGKLALVPVGYQGKEGEGAAEEPCEVYLQWLLRCRIDADIEVRDPLRWRGDHVYGRGRGQAAAPQDRGVVWCGVVWCAEGAVTKRQRPGCLPTGTGKRAGLCVLCARCV